MKDFGNSEQNIFVEYYFLSRRKFIKKFFSDRGIRIEKLSNNLSHSTDSITSWLRLSGMIFSIYSVDFSVFLV